MFLGFSLSLIFAVLCWHSLMSKEYTQQLLQNYEVSTELRPIKSFTCVYSTLWCTCFSNNRGGCTVGCSPNTFQTLYNQTHCPEVDNYVLAGFHQN